MVTVKLPTMGVLVLICKALLLLLLALPMITESPALRILTFSSWLEVLSIVVTPAVEVLSTGVTNAKPAFSVILTLEVKLVVLALMAPLFNSTALPSRETTPASALVDVALSVPPLIITLYGALLACKVMFCAVKAAPALTSISASSLMIVIFPVAFSCLSNSISFVKLPLSS